MLRWKLLRLLKPLLLLLTLLLLLLTLLLLLLTLLLRHLLKLLPSNFWLRNKKTGLRAGFFMSAETA